MKSPSRAEWGSFTERYAPLHCQETLPSVFLAPLSRISQALCRGKRLSPSDLLYLEGPTCALTC